jgi:hypothetical protein
MKFFWIDESCDELGHLVSDDDLWIGCFGGCILYESEWWSPCIGG